MTQICHKRINIDFNAISLQLEGSIGLPENLREILTQLDENDLLVFFEALKLPCPSFMAQKSAIVPMNSLMIEILIKESAI